MKYIWYVALFLLGSAIMAGLFLALSPLPSIPPSIDLGIELGRKLGLAAAEKRYDSYKRGHASLRAEAEEADQRTKVAETSLREFRQRSYAETNRLKEVALEAKAGQEKAIQGRVALHNDLNAAWDAFDQATVSSDQVLKKAARDVEKASKAIYSNLKDQLDFSLSENSALRSQLDLKEQEIVAVSASMESWKAKAESEKKLRQDAEAYIRDFKDSGFYVGIGGSTGYFKLFSGHSGPGAGIALNAGWRF